MIPASAISPSPKPGCSSRRRKPGSNVAPYGDFLYDDLDDDRSVDLESGEGAFDLREASLVFSQARIPMSSWGARY